MALLTRDQILTADDLGVQDVEVPEWGGTVRIRGLTGTERDRFEFAAALARTNGGGDVNLRAAYAGRSIIDDNGRRVFTDGDFAALGAKSGVVLDRLFDLVREMSGMTDAKLRAAAANFGPAPPGDSPSA